MYDILSSLNTAQKEAVETISGPVLIVAGPGSGKTRVITHRIAYLMNACRVSSRNVMAVTFTNKAAREMQERLGQLAPIASQGITIGTFHAICAKILRIDGKIIGIEPGFVIYDQNDQLALVKRGMTELNLDPKQYALSAVLGQISAAKSQTFGPKDYIQRGRSYFEEIVGRVYERYQEMMRASNALDFDDLLMRTVELFRAHKEVLERYQERYVHVMVDEFQDTNTVQYEMVKMLAGKHRNLCVVGDPDQSIYSWRSADLRNILNFEKDYPDAKTIILAQNYRSTKTIISAADAIISVSSMRKPKRLFTDNEQGVPVTLAEAYNEQEEALFVAKEIGRLVSYGGAALRDVAVMYRTNAQSRAIEEAFIRCGMPYKLVAGTRFYERREVKDIIAYLRLILNPADDISLIRIINTPPRGIGERTVDELLVWAKRHGFSLYDAICKISELGDSESRLFTPRAVKLMGDFQKMIADLRQKSNSLKLLTFFDRLIERIDFNSYLLASPDGEDRLNNILELRGVVQEYDDRFPEGVLPALLEGVALVSDVDSLSEVTDTVTLITLHQAKGLEFPIVFIVGMEDGILPHIRSFDAPEQIEEERRLCYVGITRAKRRVYLMRAFRRSMMGASNVNAPSRFLKDIPEELTCGARPWKSEKPKYHRRERDLDWAVADPEFCENQSLPDVKPGDDVYHDQFGRGKIVSINTVCGDTEVVVSFREAGTKKLLLSLAKLEKME
ncbi:MAG: UvrD-helicase domain-containing protein [Dehalococcoidia bacterium]|nr:UvrD-helicase domain-containing protein [Dehalococcoidia bacterium]